ncbi:AAEL013223-PA [Aedes aegypti]|uniref:AAEL013223-PA n=1 Tax=Aedes aegypti TaxID=7159 RepID=Q16JT3_AEDAE|nr:AAEL013223-PA [Aedes aegypti]
MVLVANVITIGGKARDAYKWYCEMQTERADWTEIMVIFTEALEVTALYMNEDKQNVISQCGSIIKTAWAFYILLKFIYFTKYSKQKMSRTRDSAEMIELEEIINTT